MPIETPSAHLVFLHAHPDDEAIFTGGTIRRLTRLGHRCSVVFATSGELGVKGSELGSLAQRREVESRRAAEALGVSDLYFLGFHDSGLDVNSHPLNDRALWLASVRETATQLSDLLGSIGATDLVIYDAIGIYGHPDHLRCHQIGVSCAATLDGLRLYEVTVDREYLHFVETHLVESAADSTEMRLGLGNPSVEITTMVDVRSVIDAKRVAMAAHASQIPADSYVNSMPNSAFEDVYGYEWYIRRGPRGPIDDLE